MADLFELTADKLIPLERMERKSANNVAQAVQVARTQRSLTRLIVGLGIPFVGTVAAEPIATWFGSLQGMLDREPDDVEEGLEELHGVGPSMAASVAAFLRYEKNREVLARLVELGLGELPLTDVPAGGASGDLSLSGHSFCVTGKLSRPRGQIHDAIKSAGGVVHTSVKKGTNYLVAGDKVGASKLSKAEKLGVTVIDEAQLANMMGDEHKPDGGAQGELF